MIEKLLMFLGGIKDWHNSCATFTQIIFCRNSCYLELRALQLLLIVNSLKEVFVRSQVLHIITFTCVTCCQLICKNLFKSESDIASGDKPIEYLKITYKL